MRLYADKNCSECKAVANYLTIKNIPYQWIETPETPDIILPQLELDDGRIIIGYKNIINELI